MDRGAWWATVHRVAKRGTRLKRLSMHACTERFFLCRGSTSWAYDECSHTELHAQNCPAVGVYSRGWDGWMASPTRWTWVWVSSRSWWWTGNPGMQQFMVSQRVRHDWVTELNWIGVYCLVASRLEVLTFIFECVLYKWSPVGLPCTCQGLGPWLMCASTNSWSLHIFLGWVLDHPLLSSLVLQDPAFLSLNQWTLVPSAPG